MTRCELFELVWSAPLIAVAPQFVIFDVALKNTCKKIDIPVAPRGYWTKLQVGNSQNLPLLRAAIDKITNKDHFLFWMTEDAVDVGIACLTTDAEEQHDREHDQQDHILE